MRRETENVRRKTVKTQNETRENEMFVNNEEMKSPVGAQFHCANASGGSAATPSRSLAALLLGWVILLTAPGVAFAQNECDPVGVDPSDNGATADSYICDQGTYPSISYIADGDLTVDLIGDGGASNDIVITDGDTATDGISLEASGADSLTLTGGPQIEDREDNGSAIVLDLSAETGDISVAAGLFLGGDAATHGIRAHSSGSGGGASDGGDIDITAGAGDIGGSINAVAGIEAVTAGGDVSISGRSTRFSSGDVAPIGIYADANGGDVTIDLTGSSRGRERGVYAETSGVGRIEVTGSGRASAVSGAAEAVAGIHAIAGTGGILIDVEAVGASGEGVVGVLTETPGLAEIHVGNGWQIHSADFAIRSIGSQVVVEQDADAIGFDRTRGALDFSGITGSSTVTIHGTWDMTGASILSQGDALIQVEESGAVRTSKVRDNSSDDLDPVTEIDFGDGSNAFVNAGVLQIGFPITGFANSERQTSVESHTIFTGLETFDNSGLILLGIIEVDASGASSSEVADGVNDDVLTMRGATFTGSGDSRIIMDVNLNGAGQANCTGRLPNGDLPVADCIDIRDGATAGQTVILLHERFPGDRGGFDPNGTVLIDVAGGTSSAEHFVMDPNSDNYSSEFGGVIDKGLFLYRLGYDEASQQHKLFSIVGPVGQQFPLFAHAAQDLWRLSSASWSERQLDVRSALREGSELGGGVWFRAKRGNAERDVLQVAANDSSVSFDNSYEQDSTAINIGVDFFSGQSGDRVWMTGVMLGYVSADVDFDQSPNDGNLEGSSVGLYGSYVDGAFFVDAAIVGNWLSTMEFDTPPLKLTPESAILTTDVQSYGAELETGWRWRSGWLSVEPLAGLSYVQTRFDDIKIPADDPSRFGGNVVYDDPTSFRGSLGVRLSAEDIVPNFVPIDLNLTARAIEEFDGDANVTIENLGVDAPVVNTFDGTFAQVTGGVTVSNASGSAMGFLNVDGMFESDYESLGVSAGFRYQW